MSRQYHLRSFLRDAPNVFLRRYLKEKCIELECDWDALGETEIVPIFDAIQAAKSGIREQCEADFCEIDKMATEGGVKSLLAEARFHKIDLAAAFGEAGSDHERVFWVFLDYPKVFRVARDRYQADNIPGRSWRKRAGLPAISPKIEEEYRQKLGAGIAEHFRCTAGKGHHWKVEHYDGDDRLYWFVYTQDYAGADSEFNEAGEFELRTRLPADKVIFVYYKAERALDIYAPSCAPKTVEVLQQIWADAVLEGKLGTPGKSGIVFDLDALKQRNFPFPFDPADGIEEVRLASLRLSLLTETKEEAKTNPRITLEVDARRKADAVYDLLDEILAAEHITLDRVKVTQARFQLIFRSHQRGGRETVSFNVTDPDMCSLKQDPKHIIARNYLRRWGIDGVNPILS